MRLLIVLALLAAFIAPAAAQNEGYPVSDIPIQLLIGANSIVRDYQYDYVVVSDHNAVVKVKRVVTILNKAHADEAKLFVYYHTGSSRVTSFSAQTYDAKGGKLTRLKKSGIEDISAIDGFDDDTRVMTATMSNPKYPYTVVFEYEKKVDNISMVAGYPQFMPQHYDQSVQRAALTVDLQTENQLYYSSNDFPEPTKPRGGDSYYEWNLENLLARPHEYLSPPFTVSMPYLKIALDKFTIDGYEGSLRSWEDYGKFMYQLLEGRDVLTEPLRALVKERTAAATTDREKIDALYRLMQERTRYISVQLGIGGWQPFPVEYVEKNKYGDCKALSNYMGAMLAEVGIVSYPVLVEGNERERYPKTEDFASTAFNHMILYVPEEDMYLECTSSDNPTGYTGSWTEGRKVLWITPEGGKLAETPRSSASDNGQIKTLDVEVAADGSADLRIRNRYFGATHDQFRSLEKYQVEQSDQLKTLHRWEVLPDVSGSSYRLEVQKDEPVAELEYATSIKNYARSMGKRVFLSLNKYTHVKIPEKISRRQTPVVGTVARFYVDTINISLPADLEIESLGPERVDIDHVAGEYRSSLTVTGNQLQWVRTFKMEPFEIPAEEYDDFRQFYVEIDKAERRSVVLRERRSR